MIRVTLFILVLASVRLTYGSPLPMNEGAGNLQDLADLSMTAPIDRWDEAIPLGNGLMGGLLWGGGQTIKVSLDRGDLWDVRTPETLLRKDWTWTTIQSLVAAKDQAKIVELFDDPYSKVPYATKIPAGRLELTLDSSQTVESFTLDLERAVGRAKMGGAALEAFFSAVEPVLALRIAGPLPQWRIVAPDSLNELGYAPATMGRDGDVAWSVQEASLGLTYAVVVAAKRAGDATELAVAVTSTRDGTGDPLSLGKQRVKTALDAGFEKMLVPHAEWWKKFWSQSNVSVPDESVQRHYDLVQYFYGAASRRGAPPMPLQGVWTADEGKLPPWHGDYHHDLNTQLTYWAYLSAGHFDEGACFLDFMWNLLPKHRQFAKDFYGAPGAAVPGVMTLDGQPMGGWGQYSLSPVQGAWVAQAFHLHWRYTMDEGFLKERAYPYCAEIAECLLSLMKPDAQGKLKLPLSTSPEIHDNSLRAWLTPNTNYDLSLIRWLLGALIEMANAQQDSVAAAKWQEALGKLDTLAVEGDDGALRLSPDESLAESHRHLSHLMSIHPLGLITIEGTDRDRKIIAASLKQFDQLGIGSWCGYSFSWRACMAARAGDSAAALENLKTFVDGYISRNGFHVNWDTRKKASGRAFTLEGNFAAAQAVHEMLLQSWGGVIRVFPAVPEKWADASFDNLRAEGAFIVSARREKNKAVSIRIVAEKGGALKLRNPFPGGEVLWSRPDVKKNGADIECALQPGDVLEGRLKS